MSILEVNIGFIINRLIIENSENCSSIIISMNCLSLGAGAKARKYGKKNFRFLFYSITWLTTVSFMKKDRCKEMNDVKPNLKILCLLKIIISYFKKNT